MTDAAASDKFVDYDAAFAELEQQRAPLVRRLFGKDYLLPAVPPAAVVIRVSRLMAEGRSEDDIEGGDAMMLAADLIPAGILDEWMANGLDIDQLALIIQDLLDAYGPLMAGGDGGGGDPEAMAPTTGAPKWPNSSNTGDSSKPTGNASTALTSTGG